MSQELNDVMHGVQSALRCMIMSVLLILVHKNHFTNLHLVFLLI
jgi:hypothetical protein